MNKLMVNGEMVRGCGESWRTGAPALRQFAEMLQGIIAKECWRDFIIEGITTHHESFYDWVTTHPPNGLGAEPADVIDALARLDNDAYLKQFEAAVARKEAETVKPGRPTEKRDNITNNRQGGTQSEYLLRRLAKKHPDVLAKYESGEFPSVRQAAIAAGIVKVPTPLETAKKAFEKLSTEDREFFHAWAATL